MFIGRKKELDKLEALYQSGQFEFAVFYGRRRVGKTTLLQQFLEDKQSIYYMAVEGTGKENLSGLSSALLSQAHQTPQQVMFRDYEMLFDYLDTLALSGGRLVLAIDEYPYLAASYPVISSMIQKHIDQVWKDTRMFLILCGSSMSFMEEQVLGYKSPLYGRRSAQFKIHPFTFWEAREMLADYSIWEQAELYGVTGGIPEYLSRLNLSQSVDENIKSLFFDESGRLFEEPTNLMKQELREPMTYHSIISAIASGASRLNEIATKTGLETGGCSNQLSSLISLQIVRKETPITEPANSRRTLYRLEDSMFLFWYRFVRPNTSSIAQNVGAWVYEAVVKPQMNDFMGEVFEKICQQYLFIPVVFAKLPFAYGEIGRWWGNNAQAKRQEEIDMMAVNGEKALFGECKWRNEKVSLQVVERLLEKGGLFHYPDKYYYLFAKSGFQEDALRYGHQNQHIRLLSFEEMCMTGNPPNE